MACLVVLVFNACFFFFGIEYEKSLTPLTPRLSNVDVPFTFVTGKFGHNDLFEEQVKKHCELAQMWMRPKDTLVCRSVFPKYVLSDVRWQKHLAFLSDEQDVSKKGGGYWFWKSVILNHTMAHAEKDSVILFSDVDRGVYFFADEYVLAPFLLLNASVAIENMPLIEEHWTKEDTFQRMHATLEQRQSGQYNANLFVLKNTVKNREMVAEWVDLVSNWHLLTDSPSRKKNSLAFKENRHDQSFLSLLIKQRPLKLVREKKGLHHENLQFFR